MYKIVNHIVVFPPDIFIPRVTPFRSAFDYLLSSARMCSKGTVVNPRRACAARVTVVGFVCVCVCYSTCSVAELERFQHCTANAGSRHFIAGG